MAFANLTICRKNSMPLIQAMVEEQDIVAAFVAGIANAAIVKLLKSVTHDF